MTDSSTSQTDKPLINPENAELMNALGGVTVIEADAQAGIVTMEFTCRPQFCHSNGQVAQGGFVTAWMDSAMAHAVILKSGYKKNVASLDITVNFLERVGPGVVRARGRIVRIGRSVVFLEGQLHDDAGKLLATATSSGMLIAMPT